MNLFGQTERVARDKKKGIGSHQSAKMNNDEWLTPPHIIKSLGDFHTDPCSPVLRPWDTAKIHWTKNENGLMVPWEGRVFCNPPYGSQTGVWLSRCAEQGNATALIFARTETETFFSEVWNKAHALLFIKGRLHFHYVDGTRAKANSGGPSVLIAYDRMNAAKLLESGIEGKYQQLK